MKKLRAKRNEGFTLIELLVVIAIIGLLSTVVLASLDTGRVKARNSKRNQMALEYINALELYWSDHDGTYPSYGSVAVPTVYYCIGDWASGCWDGLYTNSTGLNDALDDYVPGPPTNNEPVILGSSDLSGTIYACSDSACLNYELQWMLEGGSSEVNCARGATEDGSGVTLCKYQSDR